MYTSVLFMKRNIFPVRLESVVIHTLQETFRAVRGIPVIVGLLFVINCLYKLSSNYKQAITSSLKRNM
jgi:hypothetical protein